MRLVRFALSVVLAIINPLVEVFRAAMRITAQGAPPLPRLLRQAQHFQQKRGYGKVVAGGGRASLVNFAVNHPLVMATVILALVLGTAAMPNDVTGLLLVGAAGQTVDISSVKDLIEQQGRQFTDFRAANDERLKQIEAKGSADAALVTKVEQINAAITETQTRLREAETILNRPRMDDDKAVTEKVIENARRWLAAASGRRLSKVKASEVKVDEFQAYRDGMDGYLRGENSAEIQNAITRGSNPEGGYWVSPDTSGRIVEMIHETSPMRQYADVVTTTKDAKEGWTDLEEMGVPVKVSETGNRDNLNTDTPEIGKWRIPVHEYVAEPRLTQQMIDDEDRDMEGWLSQKAARRFARSENTDFSTGTGVAGARGFVTYAHASAPTAANWRRIQYIKSGAAGDFAATDPGHKLIDMVHALKTDLRQGAIWAANNLTIAAIRKLKDADGAYLLQLDFSQGFSGRLLGYPVIEWADLADIGASSYSLAFANFKEGYTVVDRLGIRVLRDPLTKKGWVKFYTTKRVGGDVTNFEAIKLMQFAA